MQWELGALYSGVTLLGYEADCSPPYGVDVTDMWSYASAPPYGFMA
jgi:hypothetical protein